MKHKSIDISSRLNAPSFFPQKEDFKALKDKILTISQNLEVAAFADQINEPQQALHFLERAYRIQRNQEGTTQKLVRKYLQTGRDEKAIKLIEHAQKKGILTQEVIADISASHPNITQTINHKPLLNKKTLLITDAFYPQISPSHSLLNWEIAKSLIPWEEFAVLCMDIPQFSNYPETIIPNLEKKVYRNLPYPNFSNKNPEINVSIDSQIIDKMNTFIKSFCPEEILIIPNFMEIDFIEHVLSIQSIKYQTIIDKASLIRHQNLIGHNKPNQKFTSPSNGMDPCPILPNDQIPCLFAYSENYNQDVMQMILRTLIRIIKKIGVCYCTIFEDINKGNLRETITNFGLEKNLQFLVHNEENFNQCMASHNIFIDLGSSSTRLLEAFQNDLTILSNNPLLKKTSYPHISFETSVDSLSEKILALFKDRSKTLKLIQEQQKNINHKKIDFFKSLQTTF